MSSQVNIHMIAILCSADKYTVAKQTADVCIICMCMLSNLSKKGSTGEKVCGTIGPHD